MRRIPQTINTGMQGEKVPCVNGSFSNGNIQCSLSSVAAGQGGGEVDIS